MLNYDFAMSLSQLTSPTAVKMAIAEYDRLGPFLFRKKYGFGSARTYILRYDGREYDSKGIAGVAHGFQFPEKGPLQSAQFVGGKLPTDAGGLLFKLGFDIATLTRREIDWTLSECEVTADVYFDCLRKKVAGEKFNRQAVINRVAKEIERSPGAVDYKFQNIDAVLLEADLPRLGDAVAPNVQKLLRFVVLDPLAPRIYASFAASLVPKEATGNPLVPIPKVDSTILESEKDVSGLSASKIDFAKKEAENRGVGRSGEEWVFNLEKRRLREAGCVELSEKVRWVSRDEGDGLGYDIDSFDIDGASIFIEVKATNQGEAAPFFVSETERAVSEYRGSSYRIYRVYNLSDSPRAYLIPGPLSLTLKMRPMSYIALPRSQTE